MQKTNFSKWFLGLGVCAAVACTHNPTSPQNPRDPASSATDPHITPVEAEILRTTIREQSPKRIHDLLVAEKIAQAKVSSFDLRLQNAKLAGDVDSLMASNLYCRITEIRTLQEIHEEKLEIAAKAAYESLTTKEWFFKQFEAFAQIGVAEQAAAIQALRGLVNSEEAICGSAGCVANEIMQLKGFKVAPLDDKAFAMFTKTNRKAIAATSEPGPNDFKPGTCFDGEKRKPNQVSAYDWKGRNWVGSVLPPGQFVFTYDDGPHATYTRQIRDTWAQGGMVKPSFFWLSKNVVALPEIVKELNSQGYDISSHSERHADLGNLAKANSAADFNAVNKQMFNPELKDVTDFADWKTKTLDREIIKSVDTITKAIGKPVVYFRLPYGSGTKNDLIGARFQMLNVDHFFWRVDSLDWQDKNPESIRDRVVAQMKAVKSGIILFHDIHPQSAAAAKLMVQFLQQNPSFQAVKIESLPGLKVRN